MSLAPSRLVEITVCVLVSTLSSQRSSLLSVYAIHFPSGEGRPSNLRIRPSLVRAVGAPTPLAGIVPYLIGAYITFRLGDMLYRGTYVYLFEGSPAATMFWIEFGLLTIVPFCMFLSSDIRRSAGGLFVAAAMYIAGIVLNRCTVFFIAYKPLYAEKAYFPTLGEFALTIGLVAAIVFVYRAVVTLLPVLPAVEDESGTS